MNLTAKQFAFAGLIAGGTGPSEAYRKTYASRGSPKVVSVKAAELRRHPGVAAHIAKLQAKAEDRDTLKRVEKRTILADIARSKAERPSDRIAAIKEDNSMSGDNAPSKVEFSLPGIAAALKGTIGIATSGAPSLPTGRVLTAIERAEAERVRPPVDSIVEAAP
jgi:hypothetical protein